MPNEIAEEWIQKADEDLGFAEIGLQHSNFFAQICFHFQQAAEKYLKAVIVANELEFRPVHDLQELVVVIKNKLPEVETIAGDCAYLNPYYIDTRYPVHWPSNYDRSTAEAAADAAEKIKIWVMNNMSNLNLQ